MVRRFFRSEAGNIAVLAAIVMVVLVGCLAIAIDYATASRERSEMQNALDAAATATGREMTANSAASGLDGYAAGVFRANLTTSGLSDTALTLTLPLQKSGGTLKLCGRTPYRPLFLPALHALLGIEDGSIPISACSAVRLKNTVEVALVLDNSGSMDDNGFGTSKPRLALLKTAAAKLVDTIAGKSDGVVRLADPVRIGIVPFSAWVNVDPRNAKQPWMDQDGVSPIHHENFDWTSVVNGALGPNRTAENVNGMWIKRGSDWGSDRNTPLTRFSLYRDIRMADAPTKPAYSWAGCVEMRQPPYNDNDAEPNRTVPSTLFVPMFAPDEPDQNYANSWWPDGTPAVVATVNGSNSDRKDGKGNDKTTSDKPAADARSARQRQEDMAKYFQPATPGGGGPNDGCTASAITPLTEVSTDAGRKTVKAAIASMQAKGNTNVPEGLAWGWRVLSHGAPFTQGRADDQRGNDKVVILLTDGANTYRDIPSGGSDPVPNHTRYEAAGYVKAYPHQLIPRLFDRTSAAPSVFTEANYVQAMNANFATLCANAKANRTPGGHAAGVLIMTVALDLNAKLADEKAQIDALESCASPRRSEPTKKLFWNTSGNDLDNVFTQIADELSNLRIVE